VRTPVLEDLVCTCAVRRPAVDRRGFLASAGASALALAGASRVQPAAASNVAAAPVASSQNELILLGTAAGLPPVPQRTGISSALVVDGKVFVIDCGRSSVTQFVNAGLSFDALAAIFVTHLHGDHTCDLFNYFLLGSGWPAPTSSVRAPIPVYGPASAGLPLPGAYPKGRAVATVDLDDPVPGIASLIRHCNQAFAYSTNVLMRDFGVLDISTLSDVNEIPTPPGAAPLGPTAPTMRPFAVAQVGNVRVTGTLVPHGMCFPSYAYRFDTPHGSVVFSGDTALTPNLILLAQGADILVHEAVDLAWFSAQGYSKALLDHLMTSHTDIGQVGAVAKASAVKTVIVSHLSPADPNLVSNATWAQLAAAGARKAGYTGDVVIGQDLARFDLSGRALALRLP
jgi:ribonuclease BN (tRNA processing enzyme)